MRAILTTLALAAASFASFAQGKITIGNDPNRLIVDLLYTGLPISQASGWNNLTMQLWGGTNYSSMILQTSFVGAAIGNPFFPDGRINNTTFILNGVAGGQVATLQLRFLRTSDFTFSGATPIFTVTAGTFAYNSIVRSGAPSYSTWPAGHIMVPNWPEPNSFSLAVLGAASLLVFHRRRNPPRGFERGRPPIPSQVAPTQGVFQDGWGCRFCGSTALGSRSM